MLVLSRRRDTEIQIGRDIKITVLAIRKHQVQLGIDAPSNIRIWRKELYRGKLRLLEGENEKASAGKRAEAPKA
jgi:carbon storage regulator